jgi:ribosomal protein L11 methyltransferase
MDAELAADLLRQACSGGVAIEAGSRLDTATDTYVLDGDAPALVKGYLPAGQGAERAEQSLRLALQAAPLQRPPEWRHAVELADEDWRHSWKKYFGIQRFGESTVVVPGWMQYTPRNGETVILIDPGMAFGTGQHPTTAMCLAELERLVFPGSRVLDLGCGSGILGIAAALHGAGRVVALDTDPLAVKAAAENAEANGVADVLEVREETLGPGNPPAERFDIVAANISGLTLQRVAPAIAAAVTTGGLVVASGFLDDTVEAVSQAFEASGLAVERVVEEGVWRSVVARRR